MEKMSKRKIMQVLYLDLAWPNYGLDVLNITMHMNAYGKVRLQ